MLRPYWPQLTRACGIWMADRKNRKWWTCGRRHYWKKDRRARREERRVERKMARRERIAVIREQLAEMEISPDE